MLCVLPCALVALASQAAAQPARPANAALQYYQAFLPWRPDAEQEKLLAEWNTVPLDDKARRLVETNQFTLMYLQRGAKLARCDWGLNYDDGPTLLMQHLNPARSAS